MARLGNIQEFEKRKAASQNTGQPSSMPAAPPVSAPTAESKPLQTANTVPAQTSTAPSVMGAAQVNNPYLERMTWKNTGIVPMPGQGAYRQEALRDMNEAEFAQNQEKMNATGKEYWIEQIKKDPLNSYAYTNYMLAEDETPEQKRKRERREQLGEVFNNLGNLIGNAANLYYTHRGGQYIDLNTANEKHRERMQRIKDKQDALDEQRKQLILNAKLSDVKTARAEAAAAKKADADAKAKDLQYKRDLVLKQIDNAFKLGQIDAQTKAKYAEAVLKAKSQKELEDYRQKNRESLAESNHQRIIEREEYRGGGSRATIRIPRSDGNGYDEYRKNDLTNPTVVSQIYHSLPDEYKSTNVYESPTMFDMQSAIGKALKDGKITEIAPDIKVGGKREEDNTAPHRKKGKSLPGVEAKGNGKSKHLNL